MQNRVLIIGAGAAGLVAGIIAARNNASVIILEHNDKIGKKILATGNGKCNFTNVNQDLSNYHSSNKDFVGKVLSKCGYEQTVDFFQKLGVVVKNKNGYLYPASGQASAIVEVLELELRHLGVTVNYNINVEKVQKKGRQFIAYSDNGKIFVGDSLVLATGSKAASKLGSDGSGYDFARYFSHNIITPVPSLVQLRAENYTVPIKGSRNKKAKIFKNNQFLDEWNGIRVDGKVTIYADEKLMAFDTGELQLTDYGISGIPVFQVSRYASIALASNKSVAARLDFMPEVSSKNLLDILEKRSEDNSYKDMSELFIGMFNKKLIPIFLERANIDSRELWRELPILKKESLISCIKDFKLEIIETNPFENAQVCAGGVDTCEINYETLESLKTQGLYIVGELLDVDGCCGGYNLQWAWSTGMIAGENAAKK